VSALLAAQTKRGDGSESRGGNKIGRSRIRKRERDSEIIIKNIRSHSERINSRESFTATPHLVFVSFLADNGKLPLDGVHARRKYLLDVKAVDEELHKSGECIFQEIRETGSTHERGVLLINIYPRIFQDIPDFRKWCSSTVKRYGFSGKRKEFIAAGYVRYLVAAPS